MRVSINELLVLRADAINRWVNYHPEKVLSGTQGSLSQEQFLAVCWVDAVSVLLKKKGLLAETVQVDLEELETDPIAE